jgi:hypothetical protein
MSFLKGLGEGLKAVKPYITAVFYLSSIAILLPGMFFLELAKLAGNIIASVPHECGHFIFNFIALFGGFAGLDFSSSPGFLFLGTLAGSLGYILVPFALAVYYFLKWEGVTAGAYVGFLAVSLDHMSWYCADALNQSGPILDGAISIHHDWYFMLTYLSILDQATSLSNLFQATAYLTALTAILIGIVFAAYKISGRV